MVDFGVARRQESAPSSLLEASRDEAKWQIVQFSPIQNNNGERLAVVVPRSQQLEGGAQVAAYAESSPGMVSMFWMNQNGRNSAVSAEDRAISLRSLANGTTFQAEVGRDMREANVQDFAAKLDETLGIGPFNPIENLDPSHALYSLYTYTGGNTRGFFTDVANETDPEAREAMGNALLDRMKAVFGEDFDYDAAARNEATFNDFLDMFSSYLGQGLYHEACVSAFEKIRFTDDSNLRDMYIMALENLAGIPASTVRGWAADGNFLANVSDTGRFGAMLVTAVGTESFIAKYPSEFWTPGEKRSIDLFMGGLDSLITGFSLSAEAKEGIRAEMYANWFVTTNPTLRSALAVEFFRVTGQDIGSQEMAGLFKAYFPDRALQARLE